MTYKIVTKYIKDVSFEISDAKTYFLLEKNIKNFNLVCNINSKNLKENIIQVDVNLRLASKDENLAKNFHVSVEHTSIIQMDQKIEKEELEKIILIKVPSEVYPDITNILVFLFQKSGFNKVNFDEKIDFRKLYENRKKNQK
mgnify:FL=1|tara:strand:- start:540 stop:965 length:426 start_codon:yes stop_codon:yes gene_type:complete